MKGKVLEGSSRNLFLGFVLIALCSGCASYVTPGGGVEIAQLTTSPDRNINELMAIEPAAQFPASMVIARVQAPGYKNHRNESFGEGRFSVVTSHDVEQETDYQRIASMPMVKTAGPINRMLLPTQLDTIQSLRTAAARLRADILLLYTFDTTFHVGAQQFRPLNVIALGFLSNKEVTVSTTASAAFFDVRTEFLYGLAEATARESQHSSMWGSSDVVDDLRVATEGQAFHLLTTEIEKTWNGIVQTHATHKINQ
ncbi:hypothetical protein [Candidatus Nitronereus thalassa]|uniref:Lipoprotein n=1 Tax=Candidatus Nitronereus thalassa TaxID=3020898 RepID=A0ABU3K5C2_9BACT|nr:hypothetical protein [Candidatus Nitronereus thalassa]MDT7041624.1 hypothetical protein [Candidatus Nitronereus thalassa]